MTVQAPFAVSRETTARYRTHALAFDADAREPTRELSVVRVAAAGSRLSVAGVRAPDESRDESHDEGAPSVLDEGDEYLHVSRGTRGTAPKALEVTWRRVEGRETGEVARTTISTHDEKKVDVDDARTSRPSTETSDSKSTPLVVTLERRARRRGTSVPPARAMSQRDSAAATSDASRGGRGGFVFGGARTAPSSSRRERRRIWGTPSSGHLGG